MINQEIFNVIHSIETLSARRSELIRNLFKQKELLREHLHTMLSPLFLTDIEIEFLHEADYIEDEDVDELDSVGGDGEIAYSIQMNRCGYNESFKHKISDLLSNFGAPFDDIRRKFEYVSELLVDP